MRESKLNGVFFLLALLLVWELAARAEWVNPLIVPAVSKIVATFSELVWSGQIPVQILASLKRAAVGYALAAAVFIPLGIFMGLFDNIRRALDVTVEMLRPIPPPVVIPAAMLFFGLEDEMKIFVIFFSCAWPILLNTLDGVRNIDRVLSAYGQDIWVASRKDHLASDLTRQLATNHDRLESQSADHAHSRGDFRDGGKYRWDRLLHSGCAKKV